jgi:outer membrane protein OmpA-like peptidoglycan-associated protein
VELVRSTYPRFEVLPFTTASLERNPIVLIGTFTLINNAGQPQGPRDAFRICLALVDLNSRTKVAGGAARARPDGIDNTPTAFFSDSPVFTADPATGGYIKACQATPVGQKIDDVYVDQIRASAAIADAIQAYDQKRYGDALALYTSALNVPGGEQLRALNGLYLSYARLGRRAEAAEAFGRIVDYSLANNRLAVKFLFRPNSTRFFGESRVTPYQVWLRQIGDRAAARNVCLELVGHTSPTGSAGLNQRLSEIRAEAVRDRLTAAAPELSGKLLASGVGFRENMIGSGRDDASDALDRRVEFKVVSC